MTMKNKLNGDNIEYTQAPLSEGELHSSWAPQLSLKIWAVAFTFYTLYDINTSHFLWKMKKIALSSWSFFVNSLVYSNSMGLRLPISHIQISIIWRYQISFYVIFYHGSLNTRVLYLNTACLTFKCVMIKMITLVKH